jgi:hypothetical protein
MGTESKTDKKAGGSGQRSDEEGWLKKASPEQNVASGDAGFEESRFLGSGSERGAEMRANPPAEPSV